MDKLWAPWRIEYIESVDKIEGCFLCEYIKQDDDKKNLVLYRGKEAYVIMNKYPYNSGHLMVVPYEHTADINSLSGSCRDEMLCLTGKCMDVLTEAIESQGFNCGMNFGRIAGAGIKDHVHMHVVPRWSGDVNFFPVLGDTKCLPEYLEKTYERLESSFKKL